MVSKSLLRRSEVPLRSRSGSVAVCAALILPLLLLFICGVVDLGRATFDTASLAGAVRAGTQYALRFPSDKGGIKKAVEEATTLKPQLVTVSDPACECPNGTVSSCTASVCGANVALRKFITVTATFPFSKIMPSPSIIVPSTLTSTSVVRTQ